MGMALSEIEKIGIDAHSVGLLFIVGLLALIPTYFNKQEENEEDKPKTEKAEEVK